jgi:hypothetical protein
LIPSAVEMVMPSAVEMVMPALTEPIKSNSARETAVAGRIFLKTIFIMLLLTRALKFMSLRVKTCRPLLALGSGARRGRSIKVGEKHDSINAPGLTRPVVTISFFFKLPRSPRELLIK